MALSDSSWLDALACARPTAIAGNFHGPRTQASPKAPPTAVQHCFLSLRAAAAAASRGVSTRAWRAVEGCQSAHVRLRLLLAVQKREPGHTRWCNAPPLDEAASKLQHASPRRGEHISVACRQSSEMTAACIRRAGKEASPLRTALWGPWRPVAHARPCVCVRALRSGSSEQRQSRAGWASSSAFSDARSL